MKTYNLTRACLYRRLGDNDCFCALGVFLSEKGHTIDEIRSTQYILFDEPGYMAEIRKLIDALGVRPKDEFDDGLEPVYRANDKCDQDDQGRVTGFAFPAEKFEEAFKAIGMDVQLIDMRIASV